MCFKSNLNAEDNTGEVIKVVKINKDNLLTTEVKGLKCNKSRTLKYFFNSKILIKLGAVNGQV